MNIPHNLYKFSFFILMQPINLALIGARGAGKSKISRKLNKLMSWPVFSTDSLISYEAGGESIEKLVAEKGGWAGFRDREYFILDRCASMKNVIIDCGGGILVEAPTAQQMEETFSVRKSECLRRSCFTVYLQRPLDELCAKMEPDANRPNLIGDYKTLLERRLPWYENCADLTLNLSNLSIKEAAEVLVHKLPKSFFIAR
jgi:shikimate kinase